MRGLKNSATILTLRNTKITKHNKLKCLRAESSRGSDNGKIMKPKTMHAQKALENSIESEGRWSPQRSRMDSGTKEAINTA
mmetsp:Transcript_53006/g.60738  ORF Transcript_53006/g.60738 Transcript_53006/m.60738 type:complete len:81 (+) Transcript_53006:769-1011(+)